MDVIIVGAGIAGLSAGIGLRRAGHRVTILEQSSLLHETGAAITISPNASRILQSWNFSMVESQMVAMDKGNIFDGGTMQVLVPDFYAGVRKTYGFPMYSVHRVDLHHQLRGLATDEEGIGKPVKTRVGVKVVDYDAIHGTVTLEDGQVLHADLIVAADGVHSKAVAHVLSPSDKHNEAIRTPRDTGWATMRWLVPTEDLLADSAIATLTEAGAQSYFVGTQGVGGLVWYPCRDNKVQNFLYLSQAFHSPDAKEGYRNTIKPGVPLDYARSDFSPILQAVIGKAQDVRFWNLFAREPLSSWHKGRLVLIGDAAHPMLPFQAQGGGQAIEDGAALGELFSNPKLTPESNNNNNQSNNSTPLRDQQLSHNITTTTLSARLDLFEKVRKNRAASLQVLSNASHPQPQSVRDAASKYLPEGRRLENGGDVQEYVFGFDVIKECRAIVAGEGCASVG